MIIHNKENETVFCVYKITNLINGKCYIGKSIDFDRRVKQHKIKYFNKKSKEYLYKSMRSYGLDNFNFEIIFQTLDEFHSLEMEIFFISEYKSNDKKYGYNLTSGGIGSSGRKQSKETREKISKIHKGRKHSKETRTKQSISHTGKHSGKLNHMYNKPRTEEQREKQSKRMSGDKHPLWGKTGELSYWFGKSHTEETLVKMSKLYLIIFPDKHTEIICNLKRFCVDYKLRYSSMTAIANKIPHHKQHKGFKCEHYNEG